VKIFYQIKYELTRGQLGLSLSDKEKKKIQQLKIAPCSDIRTMARPGEQFRAYAHVGHKPDQICVRKDFIDLPECHQVALILHEIGHLISEQGHDEPAADLSVKRRLNIEIKYDNLLEIQYVDPEVVAYFEKRKIKAGPKSKSKRKKKQK
jgi:hypothetical protein